MNTRRPILGNGEALVTQIEKTSGGPPPPPPKSYEQARLDTLKEIQSLRTVFTDMPEKYRYMDELFYCLRAHPEALAKSYELRSILVNTGGITQIGTRPWRVAADDITKTSRLENKLKKGQTAFIGKTIFVRSDLSALKRLEILLHESQSNLTKEFIKDICRLEHIDLLSPAEQIMGFEDDWTTGHIELVLHPPSENPEGLLAHFMQLSGTPTKFKFKTYPSNITFLSFESTREIIDSLTSYNPLRAVRPIRMESYPALRHHGSIKLPLPPPPDSTERSSIKVGIFDGGILEDHPYLTPFCNQASNPSVALPPNDEAVEHGTAVAGAVLYGSLNQHDENTPLKTPNVSVESFRVFPLSDDSEGELYEAIDLIESVVPSRPDISVYNLSFGPEGPIIDEDISRFTYALDNLAFEHNVLFAVACGNAGTVPAPYNRIQAPADLVNGLGVGAHDGKEKAVYSCPGPGREGAKTKPDILAYGGSANNPIHLLSTDHTTRALSAGTSYAAPIASGIAAQLIGLTERINPLLARALMIHNASHPRNGRCPDYGYGNMLEDPEQYLNCPDKTATILFQGALDHATYSKLPIPIPEAVKLTGKVHIRWTIAIESAVSNLDSLQYTSHCIEETFHPHCDKYNLRQEQPQKTVTRNILTQKDEIKDLIKNGWKISALPATDSKSPAVTEDVLRKTKLKWDTIISNEVSKLSSSLKNPMLVLHAMARNGVTESLRYGVAVTISAPKYSGDIYNDIATHIPQLVPIRVKAQNEIRIRT